MNETARLCRHAVRRQAGQLGNAIDFNRVYAELIKPVLQMADLEAFRADEEGRAGDIRTDMFQELVIAKR